VGPLINPRSFRNFPMQANGAEILRLACSMGFENGLTLCAPVHDAILLEAPLDELENRATHLRALMVEASSIVLGGFEIRTDLEMIRFPGRYMDERGSVMWNRVMAMLNQ